MSTYAAFIRQEEGTCYGVDFLDFPGCISAGDTIEEAVANSHEALHGHIEGMQEDNDPIPHPCQPIALTHYLIGNPMNSP